MILKFCRMKQIVNTEYKFSELTGKIIGCAMEVHRYLGNGFQEIIYQRALAIEMSRQGLSFAQEFVMTVFYKGEYVGKRRVDFMVEDAVSVELKARTALDDVHLNQAINYLEVYHIDTGLLINFGAKSLQFKRLINSKPKPKD
jgi:GxxExxY protein